MRRANNNNQEENNNQQNNNDQDQNANQQAANPPERPPEVIEIPANAVAADPVIAVAPPEPGANANQNAEANQGEANNDNNEDNVARLPQFPVLPPIQNANQQAANPPERPPEVIEIPANAVAADPVIAVAPPEPGANANQNVEANQGEANNDNNEDNVARLPQFPVLPPIQNANLPGRREVPAAAFLRPIAAPSRLRLRRQLRRVERGIGNNPGNAANNQPQNFDEPMGNALWLPDLPNQPPAQNANLPGRREVPAAAFLRPLQAPPQLGPGRPQPGQGNNPGRRDAPAAAFLRPLQAPPQLGPGRPQPGQGNNPGRRDAPAAAFLRPLQAAPLLRPVWLQPEQGNNLYIPNNPQPNPEDLIVNAPRLPDLPNQRPPRNPNNRILSAQLQQRRTANPLPLAADFGIPVQQQAIQGASTNQDAAGNQQPQPNESAQRQDANAVPPAAAAAAAAPANANQNEGAAQAAQRPDLAAFAGFRPIDTPPGRARRRREDSSPDSDNNRTRKKRP